MKRLFITAAALVALAACDPFPANVMAQTTGTLTTPPKLETLQQEYKETSQKVRELSDHLLRLEGAISLLQMQATANDAPTTGTGHVDN